MTFLKIIGMIAMIVGMAIPFIIEYIRFKKDEQVLSATRFRLVVGTLLYTVAVTVVLTVFGRLAEWVGEWGIVEWIRDHFSSGLSDRVKYTVHVYSVILLNIIIGAGFVIVQTVFRLRLRKIDVITDGEQEKLNFVQRTERKILDCFGNGKWYFVGRLLNYLCIALSVLYAVLFILFQMPAVFSAHWIPYTFISSLLNLSYQYPVIGLLLLWDFAFFLLCLQAFAERCPDWKEKKEKPSDPKEDKIREIDEDCRKNFNSYYASSMELKKKEPVYSSDHERASKIILKEIENDPRNGKTVKDIFVSALDRMERAENGILFNGGFYSEFSMYFFRHLSVRLARGDNLIFVCNGDGQSKKLYDYLRKGLCEISSLYYPKSTETCSNRELENPIWKIVVVNGTQDDIAEHEINGSSILITTPDFLCSDTFEESNADFISYLDAVIFTDTVNSIHGYEKHLSLLNTKLMHMIENTVKNPICVHPIRYFFFDDTRTPGIDKALKNMFSSEIETVDIMDNCYRSIVSCYNFNAVSDESAGHPHFIPSEENLSVMLEMAINCIACGASSVSVFVDETLPYQAIEESMRAHLHKLGNVSLEKNLHINEYSYNPDRYSVILALDGGNNLPSALRKYISMTTDSPSLVILFSHPYLMRDYYIENMEKLWQGNQILRIPVTEGTEKDIAQKILMKANSGGISKEELLRLAEKMNGFDSYVQTKNINKILEKILAIFDVHCTEPIDVYRYFEYTSFRDFDKAGKYAPETRISLRSKHLLYDIIRVKDHIVLRAGENEAYDLPLPKKRLSQNYIEGQNLIYQGKIYSIQKIDTSKGEIFADLAGSGYNNEVYRYIQARTYRLDCSADELEYLYPSKRTVITQQRSRAKVQEGIRLEEACIVAFRVPAEVLTEGYYDVDPHSMDRTLCEYYHPINGKNDSIISVQTYRCYGKFPNPTYTRQKLIEEEKGREAKKIRFYGNRKLSDVQLNTNSKGISVLSVRLCGEFGKNKDKIASLAAVMLDEILRAKFPSVADSLSVSAVNGAKSDLLCYLPKVEFVSKEYGSEKDIELLILEDCAEDLGVISALMSGGDNILHTLFAPIKEYLDWYMKKEELHENYLWFGQEEEPECFDFAGWHALSSILGDVKNKFRYQEVDEIYSYAVCDFCGKRYADPNEVEAVNERMICRSCAEELVGNNKTKLKMHLDQAKMFMERTYGITMDDTYEFCFESTMKIIHAIKQNKDILVRNTDITAKSYIRDKTVNAEYDLPSANLSELLVRELTHIWQIQNRPDLDEDIAKGHLALVGIEYLCYLKQKALAEVRKHYYESSESRAAEGYRSLTSDLMKNPQYNNNPFLYLMGENEGQESVKRRIPDPKRKYGEDYETDENDRSTENLKYFYYERLSEPLQEAYKKTLDGLCAHAPEISDACFNDEQNVKTVMKSIAYDHPEVFWYTGYYQCITSTSGGLLHPCYSLTKEEADALQARMEPVIAEYLEGITESMSAYDVALNVYIKLINRVDYDSIDLERQRKEGLQSDELDELRTICGVFLNEKSVCEGYARAYQYLMQKCGVECAECAGSLTKEEGYHAWNLIKLDGDYYYLDATWDDHSNTNQEVKNQHVGFEYFCITTEELLKTRKLDLMPLEVPEFTATKCNYYYHNKLVLDTCDFKKIGNLLNHAIKKGDGFCTFKFKTKAVYDEAYAKISASPEQNENLFVTASKLKSDAKFSYVHNDSIQVITIYID